MNEAAGLGIETVYQDLALCNNLDIVQNMFLGRERTNFGLLDENSMEIAAVETLTSLSVTTVRSVRQPVASLSGGQRQAVAVAKADLALRSNPVSKRMVLERLVIDLTTEPKIETPGWMQEQLPVQ